MIVGEDGQSEWAPCTLLPAGYFEARAAFAEVAEILQTPEQRRARIAQRMRAGKVLSRADQAFAIACVAGEVDAPAPLRRGRKPKTGLTAEEWRRAAVIQFYRRLLPEFDQTRPPVKQAVFTKAFGYGDDKSVRELEKAATRVYLQGDAAWWFLDVIAALIQAEGLPDGTHYCPASDALKEPLMRIGPLG